MLKVVKPMYAYCLISFPHPASQAGFWFTFMYSVHLKFFIFVRCLWVPVLKYEETDLWRLLGTTN